MGYRPDNWEKTRREVRERLEFLVGASKNSADHKNMLIDAGADAMLEALKVGGVRAVRVGNFESDEAVEYQLFRVSGLEEDDLLCIPGKVLDGRECRIAFIPEG